MKKALLAFVVTAVMAVCLAACGGGSQEAAPANDLGLEPGTYIAEFNTDSSMFHVNEAKEGKGVLTVTDEGATIHICLVGTKIVNLYVGTSEEAQAEGAVLLEPTPEEVTYSDGYTETVYAFDVPVPAIGDEFDVAILGTKGTWYDHKVSVDNPVAE